MSVLSFLEAALMTVIPGNFMESLPTEEHSLHRPASSPTHLLLPSPQPVSPLDLTILGLKGTSFSPFMLQTCLERSRNCQGH